MTSVAGRIIWMEPDRFDLKPNKSPWLEMARALGLNGFNVILLTGYGKKCYQPQDVNITIVSRPAISLTFLFRYSLMLSMLVWVIRNGKRDDIFILNQATLLLSPILRILGFSNLHLDIRTLPLRANKSLKKRIDRFLFWTIPIAAFWRLVKGYSFITDRLESAVEEEFGIRFNEHIIWQSGVNTKIFRPIKPDKLDAADSRYRVFYHGSIYGNRGVDKIVEAMALLRPEYKNHIRLIIVGPVLGNISLAELIEKKGLDNCVAIEGLVPYEEIPGKIAQADCCICPLPDLPEWNVSSPLKVFEYMACGKPIILTPIPAHRDVADGLDFIIWAEGSGPEDLRDAMERAFEDRDRLSTAAILRAADFVKDKYDWEVQGQKLSGYFRKKFLNA